MKKNWKKVLSLILALSMVLTMNTAAFATEPANPEAAPVVENTTPEAAEPVAEEPAAETPAVEEPAAAETPEAAPTEEPAATAVEETNEEPAKAETPKTETPATAPAVEEEEAVKGPESEPGTIYGQNKSVSGVFVTFEKHSSVVSDNKGNLKIGNGAIVGLYGAAEKPVTVDVGEGAEVYVNYQLNFTNNNTSDRESVNFGTSTHQTVNVLKNVQFTGSGKIYFFDDVAASDKVSVNAANTIDLNYYVDVNGPFVLSSNRYEHYTGTEGYKVKSFTGLEGSVLIAGLTDDNDLGSPTPNDGAPAFAKSVSASGYSLSMNIGISLFKDGKYQKATTSVNTLYVGNADENKDLVFGKPVFYENGGTFYYYNVSAKPAAPDVAKLPGYDKDKPKDTVLMESAWRIDGIDLDEAVRYYVTGGTVEYVISDSAEDPAVTAKGWDGTYVFGNHDVFKTFVDGKKLSANDANKDWYLFARESSAVTPPATNTGFYSDPVLVGKFTTLETPDSEGITISLGDKKGDDVYEIEYMGDADAAYIEKNKTLLERAFKVEFNDGDEKKSTTKKLEIGKDQDNNPVTWKYDGEMFLDSDGDGDKDNVSYAVKIDGSTVGQLRTYFVRSVSGLSADGIKKMSESDLRDASEVTIGGMKDLYGNSAGNIQYISANEYFVRSFFEAYEDGSRTGTGNNNPDDPDLPYITASSNVIKLKVNKANLSVVPQVTARKATVSDNYMTWKHYGNYWYSYSNDPQLKATSGNDLFISIYAFDKDKNNCTVACNRDGDYFDGKQISKGTIGGIIKTAVAVFDSPTYGKEVMNLPIGGSITRKNISSNGEEIENYTLKISDNTLDWTSPVISENFIINYDTTYSLAVYKSTGGGEGNPAVSGNLIGFTGRAYYGSTPATIKDRIVYDYTETYKDGTKSKTYWSHLTDTQDANFGDIYYDQACTQKISTNELLAAVEPGEKGKVYVSINSATVISENLTGGYYDVVKNKVAEITIEPRPMDIYAHAYPSRGIACPATVSAEDVYGDVKEDVYYDSIGRRYYDNAWGYYNEDGTAYWDSDTDNGTYVVDKYNNTYNKAFFQGDALVKDAVKLKNADLIDTTEATASYKTTAGAYRKRDGSFVWVAANSFFDDPYKAYLEIDTGFANASKVPFNDTLAGKFYANTAVGYVTVLPRYTVTYMLQYNDERYDLGKEAAQKDKRVVEEKVITKEMFKAEDGMITLYPYGNKEVRAWTRDDDGILNHEDNDFISQWKYKTVNDTANGGWTVLADGGLGNDYREYADVPANSDYVVNAVVSAWVNQEVRIASIDPVYYKGLSHVADLAGMDDYNRLKIKATEIDDLDVTVFSATGGAMQYGKDYTISYKNNKDASVYYEDGSKIGDKVIPKFTDKKKKPQVTITGAGKYKGKFKATVYFDIYPVDIEDEFNNTEDNDAGTKNYFIRSVGSYYNNATLYPTVTGVKDTYLANTGKSAKVNFKVQNVQYPSKVVLNDHAPNAATTYSNTIVDKSKGKVVTLKKGKDYVEVFEKQDTANDKNGDLMGWIAVKPTELVPGGDDVTYRVYVKGKGNYTGSVAPIVFHVYDKGKTADISKLKITTPKNLNWEKLMVKDGKIQDAITYEDLGIKVESKEKEKKGKQTLSFTPNYSVQIYKVDKKGKVDWPVYDSTGTLALDTFDDAGLYKIVMKSNGFYETVTYLKDEKTVDPKKKPKSTYYVGTLEKTFTIKGIDLKAKDFKLAWNKEKWNGTSKPQTLSLSDKTKSKVDQKYINKYLKNNNGKYTFEPFYNSTDKRFEAYIRDWVLGATYSYRDGNNTLQNKTNTNGNDTLAAANQLAGFMNDAGKISTYGDVFYYDNGAEWKVDKQLDVYRFVFNSGMNNKDVGTYTIEVPTDGIFGTDSIYITYQRTGTATKILEVKNKK